MKDGPFATEGNHECDNCGLVIPADKLLGIADLSQRVEAGNPIPSGECPHCGALCYPVGDHSPAKMRRDMKRLKDSYQAFRKAALDGGDFVAKADELRTAIKVITDELIHCLDHPVKMTQTLDHQAQASCGT
jgi:hypothetical protein